MWSGQEGLVEEQDLHLFRSPYIIRILYGLVGALAGWFGTIYLSLGLGFLSIDLAWAVAFVMATYGYGRNFLLKHVLIGRKYRTVFLFAWLNRYVVFVSLVFYSLTAPQLFLIPDF